MSERIRTVKPEALRDEELWDLESETGLPIFRAFVGLWCQADKRGRFEWRHRPLKASILPYWDGDFLRVLDALASRGFLVKYTYEGREYGWIPTFEKHQHINGKENDSRLPAPPKLATSPKRARVVHVSDSGEPPEGDAPFPSLPVPTPDPVPSDAGARKGGDFGFGELTTEADELPDGWEPNQANLDLAKRLGLDEENERGKYRAHRKRERYRCGNWDADYELWLRKAWDFARERKGKGGGSKTHGGPSDDWPTDADLSLREAIKNGVHGPRLKAKLDLGQLDAQSAKREIRNDEQERRDRRERAEAEPPLASLVATVGRAMP